MTRRAHSPRFPLVLSIAALVAVHVPSLGAQDADERRALFQKIHWAEGPSKGALGDVAEVGVPAECRFTDGKGTKTFLEATENPPTGEEVGLLFCADRGNPNQRWFVVFEFDPSGFVRDDEKRSLDQAAILKTIQRATEAGNEDRRHRGWEEIEVIGWRKAPYYDEVTHNLTWSTLLRSKSSSTGQTLNHSVRLLGRRGVMHVDLVASPEESEGAVASLDSILQSYSYVTGERYSEWRAGDKVAKYGLTALVAGGAGAAAVKLGLFGKLWKVILALVLALKKVVILVVVGIGTFFKKLFRRKPRAEAAVARPSAPEQTFQPEPSAVTTGTSGTPADPV